MRFIFVAILLVITGCGLPSIQQDLIGKPAPYTRVMLLGGGYKGLDAFKGKPLVIAFWSADCSHCRSFMPKLNKLAKEYQTTKKAAFLAVNVDGTDFMDKVVEEIHHLPLTSFLNAYSGNDVFDEAYIAFKGESLPYVVVLDAQGKVAGVGDSKEFVKKTLKELSRL